jgi:predicted enzyme related to lactoylglutathione lyase
MTDIGDFDGDGVRDLAVGAANDDGVGNNEGAVWLLFLNPDGTVKEYRKISSTEGNFTGPLDDGDRFSRVASLGDLDGDGVIDLAVGAPRDGDGGTDRGAVWILFLNSDGTVREHRKISQTEGGFDGVLDDGDRFGWHVTTLGDFDNDGNPELAVGAIYDDDGAVNAGAVWILFLNSDGTVKGHQKISNTEGGFVYRGLDPSDWFGYAVAPLGDLDEDGVSDLAVGAFLDDDGGASSGAVWILFLNSDGTVKQWQKISAAFGGFTGDLDPGDFFSQVWELPDMDGDQVQDLAVGAPSDDDGGLNAGAVWVLFLNRDGTVKGWQKISNTEGGFDGVLDPGDRFGWSGAFMGDLNGDTRAEMAVGALWDDDRGPDCGAVWMLFLNEPPVPILLQDFRAIAQGTSVELQWMLATDEPVSAYRVLRSVHGSPYAPIFEGLLDPGARTFRDSSTEPGTTYQYILEVTTGWGTVVQSEPALVTVGSLSTRLGYNTPNPFNPKTTIEYSLAASANVALRIYDSRGVLVRTLVLGTRPAGSHRVEWNGEDEHGRSSASGVYFYRLEGDVTTLARRMILLK